MAVGENGLPGDRAVRHVVRESRTDTDGATTLMSSMMVSNVSEPTPTDGRVTWLIVKVSLLSV